MIVYVLEKNTEIVEVSSNLEHLIERYEEECLQIVKSCMTFLGEFTVDSQNKFIYERTFVRKTFKCPLGQQLNEVVVKLYKADFNELQKTVDKKNSMTDEELENTEFGA